jgi:hypothetical protein
MPEVHIGKVDMNSGANDSISFENVWVPPAKKSIPTAWEAAMYAEWENAFFLSFIMFWRAVRVVVSPVPDIMRPTALRQLDTQSSMADTPSRSLILDRPTKPFEKPLSSSKTRSLASKLPEPAYLNPNAKHDPAMAWARHNR